jgi:hypothetical protein
MFIRDDARPIDGGLFVCGYPGQQEVSIIQSAHNTGILFSTKNTMLHGISEISHGTRYSMVLKLPEQQESS